MNLVGHRTRPTADIATCFHSPACLLLWDDRQRALKEEEFFGDEHVVACTILDGIKLVERTQWTS